MYKFVQSARLSPANDPRVGTGPGRTELIIQACAFQAVATKIIVGTEFRLTLSKVTNTVEFTDEPIAFRARLRRACSLLRSGVGELFLWPVGWVNFATATPCREIPIPGNERAVTPLA